MANSLVAPPEHKQTTKNGNSSFNHTHTPHTPPANAFEIFISKFKFLDRFQSRYAQQDTDFSSQFSTRRMFDTSSTSTMAGMGHMSSASTSSLTGHSNANNKTNLIVNYLPQDMNDRELYSLFRPSGPIETCRIMRDYKVCF